MIVTERAEATCSANVSLSDQGTTIQVTGTAGGACGGSGMNFYLDGGFIGAASCATATCTGTVTINKWCLKTGSHEVKVISSCGKEAGDDQCDADTAGEHTASFTVNTTPTISVSATGPDPVGDGDVIITASFPNTSWHAHRRVEYDILDPNGVRVGGNGLLFVNESDVWTTRYSLGCRKGGAYTVKATAFACGGIDPVTYPTDPSFIAHAETTISVPSPKPTVSISYDGLDPTGKGTVSIPYSFTNTTWHAHRRTRFEVFDAADNRVHMAEATHQTSSGTWTFPFAVTCFASGTYRFKATAFACGGVSPTTYPSDAEFIASDEKSVTVNIKPSAEIFWTGPDANGDYTINIPYSFPNTDFPGHRDLVIKKNGVHHQTVQQYSVTGTHTFKTKECGEYAVTAVSCDRSTDAGFKSDPKSVQLPANLCKDDTRGCPYTPGGRSTAVGGPINIGSGDMMYAEPLFRIAGEPTPLEFTLTFHSNPPIYPSLASYPFGPGWYHSYGQTIRPFGDGLNDLGLYHVDGQGHETIFTPEGSGVWRAARPAESTGTITLGTGGYLLTDGVGTSTLFDIEGRWQSTTDRWGNTFTGTWVGGQLASIADPVGRTIALSYDNGTVVSVTAGAHTWRFTYTSGVLTQLFDPLHTGVVPWRTYSYINDATGEPRRLNAVRDEANKLLEGHTYDWLYRATTSYKEGDREHVTVHYNTPSTGMTRVIHKIDGVRTQVTDYTILYQGGRYFVTNVTGSCSTCGGSGGPESFTYDTTNRLLSATSPDGTTAYTYHSSGNLASITEAAGTALARTTTFEYTHSSDPSLVTVVSRPSIKTGATAQTSSTWNATGTPETVLTRTDTGYTAPSDTVTTSRVTTTTFDTHHRVISIDGPRTEVADITTRAYYPDDDADLNRRGRLWRTTSPEGLITTFDDYDIYGTARRVTDPNNTITQLTTDARGRTTSVTRQPVTGDPNENAAYTSTTTYDGRDRITSVTNPRNVNTSFEHEDGTNQLTSTTRRDEAGNQRERLTHTLNLLGWKTREEAQYCATPAVVCSSWTATRTQAYAHDLTGRVIEVQHADNTKIKYQYDATGRITGITDENHASPNTTYTHDALDRMTRVTQQLGATTAITSYAYDVHDNLRSVTDPNGNTTTYQYDDFGQIRSQVSPVTGTTTYAYDAAGNLTSTTDANSASTLRTYDADDRVLTATATLAGMPSEVTTWSYDAGLYGKGRLTGTTDPLGTTTYAYDRRGLLRREERTIEGATWTTAFGYDPNGNRTSITYPSGRVVTYTFDFADRPLSASSGGTTLVQSAAYRPFGPMTQVIFGNGTTKSITYDQRERVLQHELTGSGGTIASYGYAHDPAGNITAITDGIDPSFNRTFAYDDLHRLVSANTGAALWQTSTYTYDKMGNILGIAIGPHTRTFTYTGTTSRLQSVAADGLSRSVTYDPAGNETGTGSEAFTYSPRNHLIGTPSLSYMYDARGIRTVTLTNPGTPDLTTLTLSSASVNSEVVTDGTVAISSAAPTEGITVLLTSDDSSVASVPSSITIPAGATTATFPVTTYRTSATSSVTVSASYQHYTQSATLTVVREPRIAGLAINPAAQAGAGTSTGTIAIDTPALPGGTIVELSSSDPTAAAVPSSITVPADATTATFNVTTADVAVDAVVTITASAVATRTATIVVYVPQGELTAITLSPANVVGGTMQSTGTVILDTPARAGGAFVPLASSNTTIATVPSQVVVPEGATSASFAITTAATGAPTAVTITATYGTTRAAALTVSPCASWIGDVAPFGSETVWFDDAVPAGAATVGTWLWDQNQKESGTQSHTVQPGPGTRYWYFYNSPVTINATPPNDLLVAYVLIDPCNPPRQIMIQWNDGNWNHRAYWGDNLIGCGAEGVACRRMGDLPPAGQWIRLEVPATRVDLSGRTIHGTSVAVYDGRAWFDRFGIAECAVGVAPAPDLPTGDTIWFDDALPPAACPTGTWQWDTAQRASGTQSHTEPMIAGRQDRYFQCATPMPVGVGEKLVSYVLMSPCHPTRELMLAFNDNTGKWSYVYWGDNMFGAPGQVRLGDLPEAGQWVRLEVPASTIGLEGKSIVGMEFLAYDGKVWWDRTGKAPASEASVAVPGTMLSSSTADELESGQLQTERPAEAGQPRIPMRTRIWLWMRRSILRRGDGAGDGGTPVGLSVTAQFIGATDSMTSVRRYSFYSPELQLIAETNVTSGTPSIEYEYAWFNGEPVAQFDNATGTAKWTYTDHLGAPILQTSANGQVVWRVEREPYGDIYAIRTGGDQHQPLGLPGQESEQLANGSSPSSDRSYNIFRWYRAGWGRYTQADPLGLNGDPHPYTYALANPARFTDPLGLKVRVCCKTIPALASVNASHCYFEFDQPPPTTIGLHGTQKWYGYVLAGLGMDTGTVIDDAKFDEYDPLNPPTCGPWKDCGADDCVKDAARTYPSPSRYFLLGPNSNAFAGSISRECGLQPPPQQRFGQPLWSPGFSQGPPAYRGY
jgi:RHS repeat-associated protein